MTTETDPGTAFKGLMYPLVRVYPECVFNPFRRFLAWALWGGVFLIRYLEGFGVSREFAEWTRREHSGPRRDQFREEVSSG